MTVENEKKMLELIKQLVELSDSVSTPDLSDPEDERQGFYFEAGEFSGEVYMSKATADKHWPQPEEV